MTIEFIDNLFRFGAIANLVWIAILSVQAERQSLHPQITIATIVCTICYIIISTYDEVELFGIFGPVIAFFGRLVIVMSWLLCITLFKDNFRFTLFYQIVLAIYVVRSVSLQLDLIPQDIFAAGSFIMRGVIFGYLIYIIVKDASGDLSEKRRSFRLWFILFIIIAPAIATAERVLVSDTLYMDHKSVLESLMFLLMSGGLLAYIVRPETRAFSETSESEEQTGLFNTDDEPGSDPQLVATDRVSLKLLEEKMRSGLYKEHGLNVARIAKEIGIPEHRLRKLINQHLGYRNISQYLNDYRIKEAQRRLADVNDRHVSILTIAIEAGYGSLRPFNHAFKERAGITPSTYREQQLHTFTDEADINSPLSAEN